MLARALRRTAIARASALDGRRSIAAAGARASFEDLTASADPEQLEFMQEMVIQVDEQDNVLGPMTKKDSHFHDGVLHRAFSVFLFNSKNELLIQKRAAEKITFPSYWANTCCSHPLFRPEELEDGLGVKRAAIRKLDHELGIPTSSFQVDELKYVTTVLYKVRMHSLAVHIRPDGAASDPNWTEYEVDHILLARGDVSMDINPNEVEQVEFVRREQLDALLADKSRLLSPWFRLIATHLLPAWWDNLDAMLQRDSSERQIHNYCGRSPTN
ncbi:TPA: hypothetical protein N0F65_007027 [Lagenidium giganteum]|uniref:isopentenyl-diphosphate Delta-isomerase n=1 Tax=Lagenidium giganteum TaxID=4803 RepID=A0AAV2YZD1_9STRA|nr:TPA: hypothetical protein N0F65_007027 [Lagenidium giganteum]